MTVVRCPRSSSSRAAASPASPAPATRTCTPMNATISGSASAGPACRAETVRAEECVEEADGLPRLSQRPALPDRRLALIEEVSHGHRVPSGEPPSDRRVASHNHVTSRGDLTADVADEISMRGKIERHAIACREPEGRTGLWRHTVVVASGVSQRLRRGVADAREAADLHADPVRTPPLRARSYRQGRRGDAEDVRRQVVIHAVETPDAPTIRAG